MRKRSRRAPGFCSIPIFPPPRSPGSSTTWSGARAAAEAGKLAFGTINSFLLWRLTGGKIIRHRRDQCLAHAAARSEAREVGRRHASSLSRARRRASRSARQCRRSRRDGNFAVRRADRDPRRRRRSTGGDGRPGLHQARHDEGDLRHRLLRASAHGRRTRPLHQSAAHHHRLSDRRQARLCARRRDLHRRRRGAVAARRDGAHPFGGRGERARGESESQGARHPRSRPSPASARRGGTRKRAARFSASRARAVRRNSRAR